jgi:hypothetical protein
MKMMKWICNFDVPSTVLGIEDIQVATEVEFEITPQIPASEDSPEEPSVVEITKWKVIDGLDDLSEANKQKVMEWLKDNVWDGSDQIRSDPNFYDFINPDYYDDNDIDRCRNWD